MSKIERYLKGKNKHSVYTRCNDCLMWGINFPLDYKCGNCYSSNTTPYYDIETIEKYLRPKRKIWEFWK